jgi:hypothetical protein
VSDLLPCPFCGAAPIFPDAKDVFGTCYDAGCEDCGIPELSIQIIDCFDHPRGHVHESWNNKTFQYGVEYIEVARQYAIEQWNSRVRPAAGAQVSDSIKLQWSDHLKPNDEVRYDHLIAQTSFGRILITWKGWKEEWNLAFIIDEHPVDGARGSYAGNTIEEAKQSAEEKYRAALEAALALRK